MELGISQRKTKILHAVVDEYIASAEPVSSKEIRDKHLPELSTATVRSELSALEDMGFLVKPHVSAGRIPSAMAYKYYVDNLMTDKPLTVGEMEHIREYLDGKVGQVEELVKRTARIVTDITNYTSVILLDNLEDVRVKAVKLVDLMDGNVLIVIVTDSGIIRDSIVTMGADTTEGALDMAGSLINNAFSGLNLGQIMRESEVLLTEEINDFKMLFDGVVEVIRRYASHVGEDGVFFAGTDKLLEHPEYSDVKRARSLLSQVGTKDRLTEIIDGTDGVEMSVSIDRTDDKGIEDCSVVTAKYKVGGRELGHIGVIGPTRMKYDKVFSVLKYIAETLNNKE